MEGTLGALDVVCRDPSQIQVVSRQTSGRLSLGTGDLRSHHLGVERRCDARGNPILQFEQLVHDSIVSFGPQVPTAAGVNQHATDTQALSCLLDTAVHHVPHAKLASDPPYIDALVGKGGTTGHHYEVWNAR